MLKESAYCLTLLSLLERGTILRSKVKWKNYFEYFVPNRGQVVCDYDAKKHDFAKNWIQIYP